MYSITFVLVPVSLYFHVPVSVVTLAITLSWIGGAIGGFIFGMVADKIGRKRAIIISVIIYSLGTIFAGLINSVYELYFYGFSLEWGLTVRME
ncbi:MFS transporter [Acidiplasma cupricumulans]|uniref:MFS transporter n=1 Tax=Acidiplasma cupricumulans TaxID=312540 RepID=UPI0015857F2C|nr:MFS transporter [Acidiplasma cupricumulans]